MAYSLSKEAAQDITDIYLSSVVLFGDTQASRYHKDLEEVFKLLSKKPNIAREREEFSPPVRIHAFKAHIVIYRVEDRPIFIIRVLHGRQEWEQFL